MDQVGQKLEGFPTLFLGSRWEVQLLWKLFLRNHMNGMELSLSRQCAK